MKKKHRRQLLITAMAYLFLWSCGTSTNAWAAASGNYTDLLPVGAAANTTVISNGSGWSLTTLPPSQTFGDALSRAPFTAIQMYVSSAVANTTNISTVTALTGASYTGSSTIPASWVAVGRTIRITLRGRYGTTGSPTWTWALFMGTTSILTTGAVTAPASQSGMWFTAQGLMTISTTATTSTMNSTYDIFVGSGATIGTNNTVSYSTNTASAVSCDLGSQLTINPTFTWGTASTSNTITFMETIVELLN